MSSYDGVVQWGETPEEWWKFYGTREWEAGGFAWTGFDYRGEPTPYGWPSINSQFGIVDMCGFPKDYFYYYKAWWRKEPSLHVCSRTGTGMDEKATRFRSGCIRTSKKWSCW